MLLAFPLRLEGEQLWERVPSPSDLEIYLYPIEGETPEEWRKQMLARGPIADNGSRHFAELKWHLRWQVASPRSGIELIPRFTLVLPYFDGGKEPLATEWRSLFGRLVSHELQHLKHAHEMLLDLEALSAGKQEVQELEQEVKKTIRRVKLKDLNYDARTDHGKMEGIK